MSYLSQFLTFSERMFLFRLGLSPSLEQILQKAKEKRISFTEAEEQIQDLILSALEKKQLKLEQQEFGQSLGQKEKNENVNQEDLDIIFQSDEEEYQSSFSQKLKPKTDPIAAMFDTYFQEESSPTLGRNWNLGQNSATNWLPPQIDWQEVQELDKTVILYRTHSQSRSLEEVLLRHKIPYRMVSGTRFLERKEIKDILAMLKFLANGDDKLSLSRFLPLILEGVGAKTLEKILAYLEDFDYPLAPKYQNQIFELLQNFQAMWQKHSKLSDLTKDLLEITGYNKYLRHEYPQKEELRARQENISELYSLMLPFDEEENLDLPQKLQEFLAQISLMTTSEQNSDKDNTPKINLMTLHQSKGLEFDTVFLVGIEDGLLPHQNSFFEPAGFEEEVRLAYVGVTRARQNLHLTAAETRVQFGQIKVNPVSRIFRPFLDKYAKRSK